MNTGMDSDPGPGFRFLSSQINSDSPSSSSPTLSCTQNSRKKRSKLIKIDAATSSGTVSKPKYPRKPGPGAAKITRPCTECGKRFWSEKALFGHMRCHPERQWRGINPPPNYRRPISRVNQINGVEALMTEEDQEVAACLLMLSKGPNASDQSECGTSSQQRAGGNSGGNCQFDCSSCKKVFGSHQPLPGHGASHKNIKGCFAITRGDGNFYQDQSADDDGPIKVNVDETNKMLMVLGHKCSICFRVFSSGQALGGHKRCHWEKVDETSLNQGLNLLATKEDLGLDLNLPAPVEDGSSYSSGLTLDLRLGI